jgi:hypothetical protein
MRKDFNYNAIQKKGIRKKKVSIDQATGKQGGDKSG